MKLLIHTVVILLVNFNTLSQQDAMTSQFWNTYSETNPAISGLLYQQSGAFQYRKQWVNEAYPPESVHANYNMLLAEHHGLGISYDHERFGSENFDDLKLIYNYQILFPDSTRLSIGAALGILRREFDFTDALLNCPTCDFQGIISGNDTQFDFHGGVAYKKDDWFLGTGVVHISKPTLSRYYIRKIHFYAMGGFDIELNKILDFRPQFIFRTDGKKYITDVNLLFTLYKKYWAGATYRTNDEFSLMTGIDFNEKYRIGYSFDYPIDKSIINHNGSHEIVIGYYLK